MATRAKRPMTARFTCASVIQACRVLFVNSSGRPEAKPIHVATSIFVLNIFCSVDGMYNPLGQKMYDAECARGPGIVHCFWLACMLTHACALPTRAIALMSAKMIGEILRDSQRYTRPGDWDIRQAGRMEGRP